MRFTFPAAAIAAVVVPAIPALAQSSVRGANQEYRDDVRDARRDYRRDARNADSRRDLREARQDYREDVRDARRDRRQDVRQVRRDNRDWRQYRNYDYNRFERGQSTYYAERYYRDGSNYQPRRLTRNDRIYRGGNGQYYCRRNDGTTGLIIGGLAGGLLGNTLANGRSSTLLTLLGAGGGAALGSSIDRGNVRCR